MIKDIIKDTITIDEKNKLRQLLPINEVGKEPTFFQKNSKFIFSALRWGFFYFFIFLFCFFIITPAVDATKNIVIHTLLSIYFLNLIWINISAFMIICQSYANSSNFSLLFLLYITIFDVITFPTKIVYEKMPTLLFDDKGNLTYLTIMIITIFLILIVIPLFLKNILSEIKFHYTFHVLNLFSFGGLLIVIPDLLQIYSPGEFLYFIANSLTIDERTTKQIIYSWTNFWKSFF